MYQTGMTAQVIGEMKRYRLDTLADSEVRWSGSVLGVDGGIEREVLTRIALVSVAFQRLKPTWNSRQMSNTTKLRL